MLNDEEVFIWLDSKLPKTVDRSAAKISMESGEAECAVTTLVSVAFEDAALNHDIVRKLREEYPLGSCVRDVVEACASDVLIS